MCVIRLAPLRYVRHVVVTIRRNMWIATAIDVDEEVYLNSADKAMQRKIFFLHQNDPVDKTARKNVQPVLRCRSMGQTKLYLRFPNSVYLYET